MREGLGLKTRLPPAIPESPDPAPPGARAWARLIARVHETDPLRYLRCLHCLHRGASLRLIAFIVERAVIVRILQHLAEFTEPPRAGPILDPPAAALTWAGWRDDCDGFAFEPSTQHRSDCENQRQDVDGQEKGGTGAAPSAPANTTGAPSCARKPGSRHWSRLPPPR